MSILTLYNEYFMCNWGFGFLLCYVMSGYIFHNPGLRKDMERVVGTWDYFSSGIESIALIFKSR